MNHLQRNLKTIAIVCAAIVTGIVIWYFLSGANLQSAGLLETGPTTETITTEVPQEIDADFTIAEANITVVHFLPIVHVTYEDLKQIPELERAMHSDINNPKKWFGGTRKVALYEGNLSRYHAFVDAVCKGKPVIECNQGVLFEYHGDYYEVFYQEFPSYHHTAPPLENIVSSPP